MQSEVKKTRKSISLRTKLDVLNRFDKGEHPVYITRATGLTPTTIRSIRSQADKIRASVKDASSLSCTRVKRSRESNIGKMEKLLALWIEDQNQKNVPLSLSAIQAKSIALWDMLNARGESSKTEEFTASRGWFHRFQKRHSFHNIKVTGEVPSPDKVASDYFISELENIIREHGYSSKQVFNVDEVELCWKRLPDRTCNSQEDSAALGFKSSKDRLTLLLGGNASGDYKMKPLLVYKSENPAALKGYSKEHLPVIYKSNNKAWITGFIFNQWFTDHAVPEWKTYCEKENMDFKILLLLDNAPSHAIYLDDLNENVKVVFLPPNTSMLIQPMEQGAITAFMSYYLKSTFEFLSSSTDGEDLSTIKDVWRGYNIFMAIHNIYRAWNEVSQMCMNAMWFKLWPQCVDESQACIDNLVRDVISETLTAAHEAGFADLEMTDIDKAVACHAEELSINDLLDLLDNPEDDEGNDEFEQPRALTLKGMNSAFSLIEEGLTMLANEDSDLERSSRVYRNVMDCLSCYKEIVEEMKEQSRMQTMFNQLIQPVDINSEYSEDN